MTFLRKFKDGRWYICRRALEYDGGIGRYADKTLRGKHPKAIRSVFPVVNVMKKRGIKNLICLQAIVFPPEFVGKKVRFVVEAVEKAKDDEELI